MKFKLLFFGLMLMSFTTKNTFRTNQSPIPNPQSPITWKEFQSFTGKFRVVVPDGEMTEKVSKIKTEMGEVAYHTFLNRPKDKSTENMFYLVNYCDYPKGTFPADSTALINEFMTTTIESSAHSVGGTVTYSGDIELRGSKGKIWRVQYNNDKALIKTKCYLVGDRFYMIQTMMLKAKSMNPTADKFLDSFQFF